MGLVSSLIGLGLGVLAALGLEALLSGFGVTLPVGPARLRGPHRHRLPRRRRRRDAGLGHQPGPARRAHRPGGRRLRAADRGGDPAAAPLHLGASASPWSGSIALAIGLTAPQIALVGLGAVLIFVGVALLAPAVARPMSSVIGRPLARLLGMSGRLGRENSMRSPRRTAQTAVGADGRPGPGLGDRRVRRLAVALRHEQRRQRHQRRPHRHPHATTRRVASATRSPTAAARPRGHRDVHRLPGPVRGPGVARRA